VLDSIYYFGCRIVDPSLSVEERAAIGFGPDPLVPERIKAKKWWNPWAVAAGQKRALRELERPYEHVALLRTMQADAIRFRDHAAATPVTAATAAETARSLAWLLWHTADRIDAIAAIEAELLDAGEGGGDAKAQWVAAKSRQRDELLAPIAKAVADVKALADLAEETSYAARLALEQQPAVELAAPTAREITAGDDMEAAADALTALHRAWTDLDVRLRRSGPSDP
jgi:hypothetical protein